MFLIQAAPGPVSVPVFQPVRPLPAVQFRVERVNVEHSVPMYAPQLLTTVSGLNQPSDNLLHHCYAHLYLKVSTPVSCSTDSVSGSLQNVSSRFCTHDIKLVHTAISRVWLSCIAEGQLHCCTFNFTPPF